MWETDLACPDTQTLPKLAQILDVSIEELLSGKTVPPSGHKGPEYLFPLLLKVIPLAMGISVSVTAVLDALDMRSGFTLLGIGLSCVGIYLLKEKK